MNLVGSKSPCAEEQVKNSARVSPNQLSLTQHTETRVVSPDPTLCPSGGVNVPSLPGRLGSASLCIPKTVVEDCLGQAGSMVPMDSNLLTLL